MSRWWVASGLAAMAISSAIPAHAQVVEALGHKRALLASQERGAVRPHPGLIAVADLSAEQFAQTFAPPGDEIILTDARPYLHLLSDLTAAPLTVAGGDPVATPSVVAVTAERDQASRSLFIAPMPAPAGGERDLSVPAAAGLLVAVSAWLGLALRRRHG